MSYRYKINVEYIGTNLAGWQRQPRVMSVQQILEDAIYQFSREKIIVFGSGRTDAGVHALNQIAHFDLARYYEPYKIIKSINHFLRSYAVVVKHCEQVSDDFHARFSAKQRYYMYRVINRNSPLALDFNRAWWISQPLNIKMMKRSAECLMGTHDFSSFRAALCQAKSALKTLSKLDIVVNEDEIKFYLSAPSFLHHMVRNIVGSLVLVGRSIWEPSEIKNVLELKDRKFAGPTAPACGLYFMKVDY